MSMSMLGLLGFRYFWNWVRIWYRLWADTVYGLRFERNSIFDLNTPTKRKFETVGSNIKCWIRPVAHVCYTRFRQSEMWRMRIGRNGRENWDAAIVLLLSYRPEYNCKLLNVSTRFIVITVLHADTDTEATQMSVWTRLGRIATYICARILLVYI